jgi:hypothetical protein
MPLLEPDRDQIEIFVDAIFRHAQTGFVSLRAFVEGSNDVFRKIPIRIVKNNLKFLCDAAEDDARRAAQNPKPVVFCPPLACFGNDKTAAEDDIVEGLTITVECDKDPEAARAKLEAILGPATVVVRSGGVWSNGNGITQDKLHLHWRAAVPARSKDELTRLKRAREICAHLVDADPTSIPICHPIRWAGSWHRKNNPRPTEIVACNPDIEIKLDEALALLEPLAPTPPPTSNRAAQPGGAWDTLGGNILTGKLLHRSIARLAMKMLRGGTPEVMAVQTLRMLMDASQAPRDDRWQARYDDIPRAVASAGRKLAAAATAAQQAQPQPQPQPQQPPPGVQAPGGGTQPGTGPTSPPPPPPPGTQPGVGPAAPGPQPSSSLLEDTLKVFREWLLLDNDIPVLAMLGIVAANKLSGDAIWLGIIAPPSSAKTEMLITLAKLPNTEMVGTVSVAGLLSGTPRRQRTPGARGGLLNKIGAFGFLVLKDFGTVLSTRPDTKAELLAALREIYDGKWTRVIGADGGRILEWSGKIGLLFGCTRVYDSYYGVIGELGDRFLLCRIEPNEKQFLHAIKHANCAAQLRAQLVQAVTNLFAVPLPTPRDISDREIRWLDNILQIAVRLRGGVKRDYRTRELEDIYGAEGPARFGKALERLLSGLDCLGVKRGEARKVVRTVAFDSVPPNRLRVYRYLKKISPAWVDTSIIAKAVDLPTLTTRRVLEELMVYGLAKRDPQGQGKPDLWRTV